MSNMTRIVPVILSGGSGSRLWPVSRGSYPKQFWPLLTDKTLLQETVQRSKGLAAPVVVCNVEHRFIVAEQLRAVGIHNARIVLEPVARNSASAIAAAAFIIAETDPDAVMWIMTADAAISDTNALKQALHCAVLAAEAGLFVTFGMKPTRPETGYGYIERGEEISDIPHVYRVAKFVEKPTATTAEALIADGQHLWNSGMFVTQAKTLLAETQTYEPQLYENVLCAVAEREIDMDFERLEMTSFSAAPDISVDYAIAERTQRAAVVPGDFGWSDIGSWDALWEISSKDDEGNATYGDVFLDHTRNCYVRSDGIVATVTGVENLIVVVTQDAVMVSHRNHAQAVKHMVGRLKAAGRREALTHNRTYRPWGFYQGLIQGDRFQVKKIVVEPNQKLSLQKHFHRAEHWIVVEGTALVTRDAEQHIVRENESIYLPLGSTHRLENPGKIALTIIEVQSGSYLGEDDIVRIEDVYNRT